MLPEDLNQLHFAHPLWLLGALCIPLVWVLYFLYQKQSSTHQLAKFIDSHLLPYLLINQTQQKRSFWKPLLLWSVVWMCLTLAMAGPRWSFREMESYSKDQSLVILLDLSESMNAADTKPSRLVRAKQKIEDLLNHSKGVKMGLIAFAADPHMITPLTDDKETIRHFLSSLGTDLVYVQGSRLSPALTMAENLLDASPGHNKAILVISDGGFEDASAITITKKLADKGIVIYTMGVGTPEGAPIKDHDGNLIKKKRSLIISKLEKEKLEEISKIGHGHYLETQYHEESIILKELGKRAESQLEIGKKNRQWDEYFYLVILPILPILLWWFRKGSLFAACIMMFFCPLHIEALSDDYFRNREEQGKQAFDEGDYSSAAEAFQDAYRRGVAYYKSGDYANAEKMFRESIREEVTSQSAYNLGNALVQQQKLKEALTAYEEVLKQWPDHTRAKENLELVKKMMEEQKQEDSSKENSEQQDQDKKDSEKQDKSDSENSENKDNQKDSQSQESDPKENEKSENPTPEANEQQNQEDEDSQKGEEQDQQIDEKSSEEQHAEHPIEASRSPEDQEADAWLNQLNPEPKTFLKNKFYLESKKSGTVKGTDPW